MKKAEKIANKSSKAEKVVKNISKTEKVVKKSSKAEIIVNKILKYELMQIPYIVNYGNRKNIYIYIKDCKIEVKVPRNVSEKKIEEFVNKKAEWIYRSIQKQNDVIKNKTRFEDGEQIKILGEIYTLELEYTDRKRSSIFLENRKVKLQVSKEFENQSNLELKSEIKKQLEKLYMNIAQDEVEAAMLEVTELVGLRPKEYKIKKLKRAWGNCSSKKVIAINMEVAKHSREFIKYVVLHEVCHLKHMNHSKQFWTLVEKYMPDYKKIKKV